MAEKRLFRIGDMIPIVFAVALAGILLTVMLTNGSGAYVLVQTPSGEWILPLSEDAERVVVGQGGLSVTLTVKDGEVCVIRADCPDQVCVHTGAIGESGRAIACVPAGIVLTVVSQQGDAPDAVAR